MFENKIDSTVKNSKIKIILTFSNFLRNLVVLELDAHDAERVRLDGRDFVQLLRVGNVHLEFEFQN